MTFEFDPTDGGLRESGSGERWRVCEHLAPLLALLLRQPAVVTSVSTAWTRTELAIAISRGPALGDLPSLAALPSTVEPWRNDDAHYALELGVACKVCRQAISWPQ